jgi:glycosyltransferase involved in cell wall biosynthesis
MSNSSHPLVSIVTPVYNGEPYLRECIESVLAQTYENWEYIIVDNCSQDATPRILEEFAARDKRIHVFRNDTLLPIIANHNRAFGLISPDSKYCKVVSADDWLLPECIARMVELAEKHPSVGIVGAYQLSGGYDRWYVRNNGLAYSKTVISGREIGRLHLLGKLSVFGNPTSDLYRADLVRSNAAFFPNDTAEADVSACVKQMQVSDFGFVHQVLSYERLHDNRVTTASLQSNAYVSAAIDDCLTYGASFLTATERDARIDELLNAYYRYLAVNALKFRDRAFWQHHEKRLRELGLSLDRFRLSLGVAAKIVDLLLNPKQTVQLAIGRPRRSEQTVS